MTALDYLNSIDREGVQCLIVAERYNKNPINKIFFPMCGKFYFCIADRIESIRGFELSHAIILSHVSINIVEEIKTRLRIEPRELIHL